MLVSAIMPTRGRPAFAAAALECFQAQTWPERELVIVDDDDAPSFGVPPAGVQYHRVTRKMTIGAKRNLACSRAAGALLIHWDDDDWSAPGRMEDQVRRIISGGAYITGYHSMLFEDEAGGRWKYRGFAGYALGTSLCYTREFWRAHPFPDRNIGEDNDFVMASRGQIISVDAGELMLARIHAGNTSNKRKSLHRDCWKRIA